MPLTRTDLEQIRAIVREELARALAREDPRFRDAVQVDDDAHARDARRMLDDFRRESAERAARPIPDGPFVDRYDASRLLGVSYATLRKWTKEGRITRRMVKGCIEVSRAEIDAIVVERANRER